MKTTYIKLFAATIIGLSIHATANAQVKKAEIIATGLTCSMCSNAINKQLEAMGAVDNIETDLNTNTFIVRFKDNSFVEPVILKDAVEKAGFFVGSLVLTMDIDQSMITSQDSFEMQQNTFTLLDKNTIQAGETKYKVIDKGFVTQKEYKKLAKANAKNASYAANAKQVYHIQTI